MAASLAFLTAGHSEIIGACQYQGPEVAKVVGLTKYADNRQPNTSNRHLGTSLSKIFLSHSHADKPFARKLAADLRAAGHAVWIDEAEINIGDSLIDKIREGLDAVDFVAAILSTASINSPWVTRELDIASNREIEEKRVVVLPLLLEKVPLPGFLKGKFYGDFSDPESYRERLNLLLRALGPSNPVPTVSAEQLQALQEQVAAAEARAKQHEQAFMLHQRLALKGKSDRLVAAIEEANERHPEHAPINATYAFEVGDKPVTLGYLLWMIGKAEREGGHPMDYLLTIEQKWGQVHAMMEAYSEMLDASQD